LTSQATHQQIIATIHQQANRGVTELSSADVARLIDASLATIKRHLQILVEEKRLERSGQARATRYSLPTMRGDASTPSPRWSSSARALQQAMAEHYRTRNAAVYKRMVRRKLQSRDHGGAVYWGLSGVAGAGRRTIYKLKQTSAAIMLTIAPLLFRSRKCF